MSDLAVLVPVLGRPHRVVPVLESLRQTVSDATVLFLPDPTDADEIAALEAAGACFVAHEGNFASKINRGVRETSEEFVFIGADDLDFRPGWFEKAVAHIRDGIEVVGVNDKIRRPHRPEHATHFLMTRPYAERPTIDNQAGPLCEAYAHACVDDELIVTATKRGAYVYARDAWVKHLHPTAHTAEMDDTYRKGMATIPADRAIFREREPLWS